MLTKDEVKEANARRLAQSHREKAEEYTIEEEAVRARSWFEFIRRHVGLRAIQNNSVFMDNQANTALMEEFCRKQDPPYIDLENLEAAFASLRASGSLSAHVPEEYVRRANTQETRFPKQPRITPGDID